MPPSMPVYYTVNGFELLPVPSTGMFASMGKQAAATSKDEAVAKAKASGISVPGKQIWGATIKNNAFVVQYQNGGKRRKTRRGRKTRRSGRKTRRSRG